jgi:hypothetical protein
MFQILYDLNNSGMIENENFGNTLITILNNGKLDFRIRRG